MTETQAHGLSISDDRPFETASRTVTWERPGQGDHAAVAERDGLGQLHAIVEGLLPKPPIMDTVDVCGFEPERGRVVVRLRAQEFHYNPLGSMHGGVIATLLDTAAGCAVHSTLGVGEAYTSLDLTTKFLRPVTVESGLLTCEGTLIRRGRRTALAQATLTDESGRTVAHATSTCMIFNR
jgi:uncharacterized protein (TIGR00369 family)